MTQNPAPAPLPGERILTCLDWNTITASLGVQIQPLLDAGGDHLLPAPVLRAHTVTALLETGLAPREILLDHRTPQGRAPIWLELDTGINVTLDLVHLDHHARPAAHTPAGRASSIHPHTREICPRALPN